jgi:hypothetical protein
MSAAKVRGQTNFSPGELPFAKAFEKQIFYLREKQDNYFAF